MKLDFGFVAVPLELTPELKSVLRKHCGNDTDYAQTWTELLNAAQVAVVYHPVHVSNSNDSWMGEAC